MYTHGTDRQTDKLIAIHAGTLLWKKCIMKTVRNDIRMDEVERVFDCSMERPVTVVN